MKEYRLHNRVKLVQGGSEFFDVLKRIILGAKHSIHLQVYILQEDKTGQSVAGLLIDSAKRGVQVFVIVDGFASQGLSQHFIEAFRKAGVQFRYFEPLFRSRHFYFGRRMHHKIVVADERYALLGGINIADRYMDIPGQPAWLDFAVYMEGDAVADVTEICRKYWKQHKLPPRVVPSTEAPEVPPSESVSVRIRENDWLNRKYEIWNSYFKLFSRAQESITIMCSYFLPGRVLRKQLTKAAARGVKVKVVVTGPSDVMVAKYAERYLYRWMLKNNIEVHEYGPTVLHAKVTVVDDHWITIGSYNVNNISAYASIELNADIRNRPLALSLRRNMEFIISHSCNRIKESPFRFTLFSRIWELLCYEFIRAVLNLSTFYFRRQE